MIRNFYASALALLATLLLATAPAVAANLSIKDGAGATQTMCTAVQTDSSQGYCFVYHNAAGAQEDLATKAQIATLILNLGTAPLQNGGSVIATQPDVYGTGTIAAATANAAYSVAPANGQSTAGFVVTGLTASGATLTFEATNDGTNYVTVSAVMAGTGLTASTLTTDGQFRINAGGRRGIRLRVSTVGTGSISATSTLSQAPFDPPAPQRDSNGDARTPTVTVTVWGPISLSANTSTTLLAQNSARVGFDIQCNGTAAVGISRVGATLTSSSLGVGGVDLVIPTSSTPPYFTPAYVSKTSAVTGYTATAQVCTGVSYAQQ